VLSRCQEVESGARMVDAILTHTLLPEVSRIFLERMMEGQKPAPVHVKVDEGHFIYEIQQTD